MIIKYRSHVLDAKIQPIKLQMPGWSGIDKSKKSGSQAQPWHCTPFVEASTYGFELLYPYKSDLVVTNNNGKAEFDCDWSKDKLVFEQIGSCPVGNFANGHYGISSLLDIEVPEGHILRIEPHPKYFTDHTNETPCPVPGHLQTSWWASVFFVVFKLPAKGLKHVFKYNEPYAQVLILPEKQNINVEKMNNKEANERALLSSIIKNKRFKISTAWKDSNNNCFDDCYRNIANFAAKHGVEKTKEMIRSLQDFNVANKKIKNKLIIKKPRN